MGNLLDGVSDATPCGRGERARAEEGAFRLFEDFRGFLSVGDFFSEEGDEVSDRILGEVFLSVTKSPCFHLIALECYPTFQLQRKSQPRIFSSPYVHLSSFVVYKREKNHPHGVFDPASSRNSLNPKLVNI